jgi:lipopolysaccharide/colanic/teichoic acid biosynthesis glycosyltransferase
MLLIDACAVLAGLRIAYLLRYQGVLPRNVARPIVPFPAGDLWFMAAAWMVVFVAFGLHHRDNTVSGVDEYRRVATAGLVTILTLIVLAFLSIRADIARGFLLVALVAVTSLCWVGRFVVRRAIYLLAGRGRHLDRLLIIGANRQAMAVADQLRRSRAASSEVLGFLSEYVPIGTRVFEELDILGEPLDAEELAEQLGANKIVIVESGLSWESLRHLVTLMHSHTELRLAMVPGLFDMHATAMTPHQIGPVLTLVPAPSRVIGLDAVLKRGVDIVLGIVGVVLALPIVAVLASMNLASSGSVGLVTREFLAGSRTLRLRHFGRPTWARRLHVSRLPDLLLVVSGRMSLLGPRPVLAVEREKYAAALPFLSAARPGFIGPWWVAGREKPADMEEELAYDLFYLRNYSIWLDAQIVLNVVGAVLGRGNLFVIQPENTERTAPRAERASNRGA